MDHRKETISSDIENYEFCGDYKPIRKIKNWSMEKLLFNDALRKYMNWHEKNAKVYKGYWEDKKNLELYKFLACCSAPLGTLFSMLWFNPNYTAPRSRYVRALNTVCFTFAAFMIANRPYRILKIKSDYRIHDYLPHEIRLALRTHDHRYIMNFDPDHPDHPLFDEKTGKAF
jgi:hypothetical protein